ncbi:hypothetical protein LGH83_10115 [Lichenihabitans sp. PAMC28606]|uniref:hypothetical protein n=1 Tax=Lichenihabitans sp. PAMC28606 TaxID=2880932 RepID=UPI001D09F053|nr:hypothetical protein [Lichenihabitans sp. PAMC28606]UDL92995.1 hypothetical protein LGH83_10115 [Lichenihabitans sp. PAMC28606]
MGATSMPHFAFPNRSIQRVVIFISIGKSERLRGDPVIQISVGVAPLAKFGYGQDKDDDVGVDDGQFG